jgi:transposase
MRGGIPLALSRIAPPKSRLHSTYASGLGDAAQVTARSLPEWRNWFFHLAMHRGRKIARVAMARKLAVRLYWMWRQGWDYGRLQKLGSHAGEPENRDGV